MKVKYISEADMSSKGINFISGFDYEVTDEVAEYLKNNFPGKFEFTESTKQKVTTSKAEVNTKVISK
jgi:hypothetical protein